jgi:hypothetical protein
VYSIIIGFVSIPLQNHQTVGKTTVEKLLLQLRLTDLAFQDNFSHSETYFLGVFSSSAAKMPHIPDSQWTGEELKKLHEDPTARAIELPMNYFVKKQGGLYCYKNLDLMASRTYAESDSSDNKRNQEPKQTQKPKFMFWLFKGPNAQPTNLFNQYFSKQLIEGRPVTFHDFVLKKFYILSFSMKRKAL